ncbi:MAG: chitin deacetylase, partial [Alphaproteobacteria bacterium]|nr:chitin deacetylase [Alphaproteobacteria bacterium]
MSWQPTRDFIGYGANPPDPQWPGNARLALNFVVNYEEGSEPSVQDGEGYTETGLTESTSSASGLKGRDLAGEG